MVVYSISSLLDISNKVGKFSVSLPFLESFVGKYSQKVTEDRNTFHSLVGHQNTIIFRLDVNGKGGNSERPVQKYDKTQNDKTREKS